VLIRIVRMTFRPDAVELFLQQFDEVAPQIRRFEGCEHLELWTDTRFPNCCTTCSHWVDEDALDAYRDSKLFRSTWDTVKPLFAAPPQAQSYSVLRPAATIDEAVSHEAMRNATGGSDD
jgi:quinol monooxygenase YgiN